MGPPGAIAARREAAIGAAREGAELALDFYRRRHELSIESKGPHDFVSAADRAVEQAIIAALRRHFPDDAVIGEESGGRLSTDPLWIIDPIDGTTNFLRGIPYWSISVALSVAGRPQLGIIADPLHDEIFAAARGQGATCNGRPMTVSPCSDVAQSSIGVGLDRIADPRQGMAQLERLIETGCSFRRPGSAALMLAHVADGRFDACWQQATKLWDVAAGVVLVDEAGGRTTPVAFDDRRHGVLAAAPALYEPLSWLVEIQR